MVFKLALIIMAKIKKLKIITQNINKKTISTLNNNKKNLIKNKIPFKKRKIPNSL